jgi:two-component system response regulator DctR
MSANAVIIEDNAISADLIARQLQAIGFQETLITGTGEEGLDATRQMRPQLVVIDERLPDSSGTELIRMVRHELPHVTVVMCTVVDDESVMEAAFAAGCNYYTVKPNGFRHLCAKRSTLDQIFDLNAQEVYK